jgi:hypothetical protein
MALTKIGATLGGSADVIQVTQNSHGLTLGYPVKMTASGYAHATANSAPNAEVVGIIIATTTNTLTIALGGRITVDGCVPNVTAGTVLFLQVSAGLLAAAEPSSAGEISKPMAVVTVANSEMIMVQQRGEVLSTGAASIANDSIDSQHYAAASIDNEHLADGAVDTAEIADDAVTADKLANSINTEIAANTAKVTNATHTGDVTGATTLTIATDAVDIAMLSATGTASSSTFLRGDNAWATAGISSTIESFTRTASGIGTNTTQALTGAGFAPKAAIIYAGDGGAAASWGFVDDANGGRNMYHNAQNGSMTTTIFSLSAGSALNVRNNTSGSNQSYASAALTSNGLTFTWNKSGSGIDVTGYILYLG